MDTHSVQNKDETVSVLRDLTQNRARGGDEKATRLNMTVWCGAGFSKSWNPMSPTDGTLFMIEREEFKVLPNLMNVLATLGWQDNDRIGFEGFKTLSYIIDMQIKYPDIRNRFIDLHGLNLAVDEIRYFIRDRFSERCGEVLIDESNQKLSIDEDNSPEQRQTLQFFRALSSGDDVGSDNALNFVTTNYDFTIETILDNLHPAKASVLPHLYRGVTPRTIRCRQQLAVQSESYKHTLFKLNGGFEILREGNQYDFDYAMRAGKGSESGPPILMLPNREQDYRDAYFGQIFSKAVRLLRETDILIVIGYSMPWEDVLIRFILHQFAETERDARGKWLVCVDLKGPDVIESRLSWTFSSIAKSGWPRILYYPGPFIEFCNDFTNV